MLKKLKTIKSSSIRDYDTAIRSLKSINENKKRGEKSTYEQILTQIFQKWVRIQGDCVLRNIQKPWRCSEDITAGHIFSRSIKQLRWDPDNCYPQCSACNKNHQYYPSIYHDWLKEKIGIKKYEGMKKIERQRPFFDLPLDEVITKIYLWYSLIQTENNG